MMSFVAGNLEFSKMKNNEKLDYEICHELSQEIKFICLIIEISLSYDNNYSSILNKNDFSKFFQVDRTLFKVIISLFMNLFHKNKTKFLVQMSLMS